MKVFLASIVLASAGLVLTGCETDVPPDPATRGGSPIGRGALVQPDRSEDPLIQEQTRVGY